MNLDFFKVEFMKMAKNTVYRHMNKSGLIIIIAPQESFRPSSSSSLDKLCIIEGLYFFGGAT